MSDVSQSNETAQVLNNGKPKHELYDIYTYPHFRKMSLHQISNSWVFSIKNIVK
jgi:hypothetical protein